MIYHKINGLYKRWNKDTHTEYMLPEGVKYNDFKIGEFSCPEFEYLFNNDWIWSEKLDGTNIRIYLYFNTNFEDGKWFDIKGRKDGKSQIPKPLLDWITSYLENNKKLLMKHLGKKDVILYGEGVGENIHKGTHYGNQHFKLFDIYIGTFLDKSAVNYIGASIGLDTPICWVGTVQQAIDKVKTLPKSSFGDFTIEGYVGQPAIRLTNHKNERIVTKIKVCDFVKEGR